jgi:hypothetical protein
MLHQSSTGAFALAVALTMTVAGAQAADDAKYPNWKGQWDTINPRFGGQIIKFDPTKPWGPAQQAPLTPEYQKVLEDSMADQANGGLGNYPSARCLPGGMPHMMAIPTQEYVVTPDTTYIILSSGDFRRIFTDGRDWPTDIEPTYEGYSIGRWIDEAGGRYDVLEVETRGPFEGPRAYDASGLPLHFDNQSIFKERFHLDKNDQNLLHDEITVIDHALTRPWGKLEKLGRRQDPRPPWAETCPEDNEWLKIGNDTYVVNEADGNLMPAYKDQPAPDLHYFPQSRK